MESLTLVQANHIVDQVSALAESGRFGQSVALSEVDADSVGQVLTAMYLVTAETFQNVALNSSRENQEILQRFVTATGGIGMWVVTQFYSDAEGERPLAVHESVAHTETIDSFVKYLGSLNPRSTDYWRCVHSRIGA